MCFGGGDAILTAGFLETKRRCLLCWRELSRKTQTNEEMGACGFLAQNESEKKES
jgi:hypothetical protein